MKELITTSAGLLESELKNLKNERDILESRIARKLNGIHSILENPAPYLKNTLSELAADKKVQKDLLKMGLHFTADYVIDKYMFKTADTFFTGLVSKLKSREENNDYRGILDGLSKLFARSK
jgi:hypothetical protein